MKRITASTISPGATTAAVRLIEPGKAWPIIPPPAATSTRKKVPRSSENRRRHSWDESWKSRTVCSNALSSCSNICAIGPTQSACRTVDVTPRG